MGKVSNDVANYRSIALLSLYSNLFAKIMFNKLGSHLEENRLLSHLQIAFKKGSVTQESVVNVKNIVCEGFYNGFEGFAGEFYK